MSKRRGIIFILKQKRRLHIYSEKKLKEQIGFLKKQMMCTMIVIMILAYRLSLKSFRKEIYVWNGMFITIALMEMKLNVLTFFVTGDF